jgi:hypothetical protein
VNGYALLRYDINQGTMTPLGVYLAADTAVANAEDDVNARRGLRVSTDGQRLEPAEEEVSLDWQAAGNEPSGLVPGCDWWAVSDYGSYYISVIEVVRDNTWDAAGKAASLLREILSSIVRHGAA